MAIYSLALRLHCPHAGLKLAKVDFGGLSHQNTCANDHRCDYCLSHFCPLLGFPTVFDGFYLASVPPLLKSIVRCTAQLDL